MDEETRMRFQRHRKPEPDGSGKLLKIRNILNIIFMIGAVIGVTIYLTSDHTTGIIVVLSAMVVKMTECCLRFFR